MKPPRFKATHPDYDLECEEVLEPALIAAIEEARSVGWNTDAIWPALLSLITNLELAEIENQRTDRQIAGARLDLR
ncbi:hypothetical protein WNZ14_22030 [Hoeflea sp. AS60]|uniref:hypothetical protein n=1 Tax=Hoeflea sp. AS60 TaxID=3135780 RepID=UPI00317729C7